MFKLKKGKKLRKLTTNLRRDLKDAGRIVLN